MTTPANASYAETYGCALAYRHRENNNNLNLVDTVTPKHNLYDNQEWVITFTETAYKIDLIKTIRDWAKACGGISGLLECKQAAEGTRTVIVTSVYSLALLSMMINETNCMIADRYNAAHDADAQTTPCIGKLLGIATITPATTNNVLRI